MKAAFCLLSLTFVYAANTARRIPLKYKAGSGYNKYSSMIETTFNFEPSKPTT